MFIFIILSLLYQCNYRYTVGPFTMVSYLRKRKKYNRYVVYTLIMYVCVLDMPVYVCIGHRIYSYAHEEKNIYLTNIWGAKKSRVVYQAALVPKLKVPHPTIHVIHIRPYCKPNKLCVSQLIDVVQ